jgi:copper chaperone CopZ
MEQRRSFRVPNMCCTTCAALIRQGLTSLPGVWSVQIAVPTRRVTVRWQAPTTWQDIERQLDITGYPPGPPLV